MNNIIAFNISSLSDISLQIATRVKTWRLELDLTQEGLGDKGTLTLSHFPVKYENSERIMYV